MKIYKSVQNFFAKVSVAFTYIIQTVKGLSTTCLCSFSAAISLNTRWAHEPTRADSHLWIFCNVPSAWWHSDAHRVWCKVEALARGGGPLPAGQLVRQQPTSGAHLQGEWGSSLLKGQCKHPATVRLFFFFLNVPTPFHLRSFWEMKTLCWITRSCWVPGITFWSRDFSSATPQWNSQSCIIMLRYTIFSHHSAF